MNAPTYLDWAAWLATLGLVGGLIPVLAWLLARSIQGAVARQAIWRGSFLVIVCLSAGESGGIFRFESGITSAKEELNGVWKVSREEVTTPRESELKGGESGVAEQSTSLPARSWWQSPTWLPGVVLLMGFGFCLTYWIVIRLGLAFYLRRYSMPTSVAVRESLMRIKGRMNYRGPCRLRLSKGRLGPFAFGTFFPTILVPSALVQQFSEEESCLVLAHEVGHFKNGDNLWRPIIDLVTFAFWWHPLVWWAQRELRMAGEFAADARAVGADFSAESLAECLVKFGRHTWMRHRLAVLFQNGAGFHSALGRRVERLLRGGPLEEQSLLSGLALSSGVMGLLVVGYLGFSRLLLPDLAAKSAIGDVVFGEGSDSTPSEIIADPEKVALDLAERQPVINAADVGSVNPSEGAELQSRELKEASKSNASENRVDREQPGINEEARSNVNLGDDESRGFVTRRYRVNSRNFVTAARTLVGDDLETEIGGQELQNLVRRLFRSAGVSVPLEFDREGDQSRPAIFFNERTGQLLVRAHESEIDGLQELISVLNEAPPQLVITVKIADVPHEKARELFGKAGVTAGALPESEARHLIVTEPELEELLTSFGAQGGVEVLSAPSVTTLSGRPTRLSMTEQRSIVFAKGEGYPSDEERESAQEAAERSAADDSVPYTTKSVETGPSISVVPWVQWDNRSIDLEVDFFLREFLGYDDPGAVAVVVDGESQRLPNSIALPRFREHEASATVRILDGQAVVLRGMEAKNIKKSKDKVPVLGDIPLLGRLFRREKTFEERSQVLVIVSAYVIDPAGNRVD